MKYLLDTNIWLELLLNQEHAEEVHLFLDNTPTDFITISDFTLHSIGVILCRFSMPAVYGEFINDLLQTESISQLALNTKELINLPDAVATYKLDFDDAYQYLISQKYNLIIVTFDNDFKHSGIQCKRPSEVYPG